MVLEKADKIQEIRIIESPMLESEHIFQVMILMVDHKIIGTAIHPLDKLITFIDNGFTLSPRQDARKKSHDLNILL